MIMLALNIDNMTSWGLGPGMAFQFLTTNTLPILQIATEFGLIVNELLGIHELGVAPLALNKFSSIETLKSEFIYPFVFI